LPGSRARIRIRNSDSDWKKNPGSGSVENKSGSKTLGKSAVAKAMQRKKQRACLKTFFLDTKAELQNLLRLNFARNNGLTNFC
jgi:hypothetical protein